MTEVKLELSPRQLRKLSKSGAVKLTHDKVKYCLTPKKESWKDQVNFLRRKVYQLKYRLNQTKQRMKP